MIHPAAGSKLSNSSDHWCDKEHTQARPGEEVGLDVGLDAFAGLFGQRADEPVDVDCQAVGQPAEQRRVGGDAPTWAPTCTNEKNTIDQATAL